MSLSSLRCRKSISNCCPIHATFEYARALAQVLHRVSTSHPYQPTPLFPDNHRHPLQGIASHAADQRYEEFKARQLGITSFFGPLNRTSVKPQCNPRRTTRLAETNNPRLGRATLIPWSRRRLSKTRTEAGGRREKGGEGVPGARCSTIDIRALVAIV